MIIKIESVDKISEAAKIFVENIRDKKIFAFEGKMGAGKTTFIKAICEELGVIDNINSPTFSIVNEYNTS
jgi:tRNA threonylcarbamoyladenosine biosynthesis protein TsaE